MAVAHQRVALGDLLDVVGHLAGTEAHSRRHLGRVTDVGAELVRPAERGMLLGDVAPECPDAALANLGVELGRGMLIAPGGVLDRRADGHEDQVVLGKVERTAHPGGEPFYAAGHLAVGSDIEKHVGDPGVVYEGDPVPLQPFDPRGDEGLVLVVATERDAGKIVHPAEHVDEAIEIELQLERAVAGNHREHRFEEEPEIAVQELLTHDVADLLVVEVLVRGDEYRRHLALRPRRHNHLVGHGDWLAAIPGGAAQGVGGVFLVEPVELVKHRGALHLDRWDRAHYVPQTLHVVLKLSVATDAVSGRAVLDPVHRAARQLGRFEDLDPSAVHLPVTDEEGGGSQPGQPSTDNIGRLLVYALRLAGAGECFIVATAVVHGDLLTWSAWIGGSVTALTVSATISTSGKCDALVPVESHSPFVGWRFRMRPRNQPEPHQS